MNFIQVKQEFLAPLDQVFDLLSKHLTYNKVFAPIQVERIQDATDPQYPDGLGSIRALGIGRIKPLKEQITVFQLNQRIEYQIIQSTLVKHHLGVIEFEALGEAKTLVTYTIELHMKAPLLSKLVLTQLKTAIKIGFAKLAQSV